VGTFVLRLSTQLDENIISTLQTTNLFLYKYQQLMLQFNSNNQFVSSYFNDNKKQSTFVNSSCHFKPNVNHLRSTSTYTSYFLLLFFVLQVSSIRRWRFRQVRPNRNVVEWDEICKTIIELQHQSNGTNWSKRYLIISCNFSRIQISNHSRWFLCSCIKYEMKRRRSV
jgi:hypothetical protein